jgi:hypothetical protein
MCSNAFLCFFETKFGIYLSNIKKYQMLKKSVIVFLSFFFLFISAKSQDVIHKKGGEKIKCKILNVTPEEITYRLLDEADGPTFTIEKAKLIKVVYASGRTETYVSNSSLNDPELYADQLKRAIKVNFFSPQLGYFQISYEKNIKPGVGFELDLSLLGLGRNISIDNYYEVPNTYRIVKRGAAGLAFGGGYKFIKMPNFVSKGNRYAHVMQGAYAKPNATIGLYKENYTTSGTMPLVKKRTVLYGSLAIDFGKQFIFGEKFSLDIATGIGYMADNKASSNGNLVDNGVANNFTGTRFGSGAGLMLSFNIKAGILLKKPKPKVKKAEE